MQTVEYSYPVLKEIFYVYGCMLRYKVDVCVCNRMIEQVLLKLPNDVRKVIENDVLCVGFEDGVKRLQEVFCDLSAIDYLFNDDNVVLKIFYIIDTYFSVSSVYCFFLIIIVLKNEGLYSCVYLFQPKWLRLLDFKDDALDSLLSWMKQQLSKEVEVVVNEEHLLDYYPFLQKEQVAFYLEHRNNYCYYTIQQYMQYNNVCYETGRMHLEQLVRLGWYNKKKVGKKFVYSRGVEYGV